MNEKIDNCNILDRNYKHMYLKIELIIIPHNN